jgi:hypothetical protein
MRVKVWTNDTTSYEVLDQDTVNTMMSHINHPPTWLRVKGIPDSIETYIRTDIIVKVEKINE